MEIPGGHYSLSDVDLVSVCRHGASAESLRRKLAPAMSALNRELAGVCTGADIAFKTTGDLGTLVARLGGTTEPTDVDRLARDMWTRCIRYAEAFWRDILGDVTRTDATEVSIDRIGRLYQKLESLPRSAVRARRMMQLGRDTRGRHVRRHPLRHCAGGDISASWSAHPHSPAISLS